MQVKNRDNFYNAQMTPICLITPPSCFLLDERVFASLGILKVAAVLERAGRSVEMVDLSGIEGFEDAIRDHAQRSQATVFGLTATTPQMPATSRIARAIRQARPDARIVLGGPHATLINAAVKRERKLGLPGRATRALAKMEDAFDVLVAGDGEDAVFKAIEPVAPKMIDADEVGGSMFQTNAKLEESPWPARHLIDMGSYKYTIDGVPAISLIAQLGCPFHCGFCGGRESPMLRRIRTRSTANILGEIEHLHRTYGVTGFMFYDDELNVNKSIVELMNGISDLQQRLGVEFKLRGFIKSELFTDLQAQAMYRAGFRWILVGFESGSPRILENIRKNATRDDNTRCMEIAARHGLKVKALMSVGHPGESEKTIMDTRDWLLEVKPADFDCTVISTYPGTPYFDHAVQCQDKPNIWTYTQPKTGDRLFGIEVDFEETAEYYKGVPGSYKSFVFTDYLQPDEIVQLRDIVEADVRAKLGIAYNAGAAAQRYEHSMGASGPLPSHILKTSSPNRLRVLQSA